MRPTPEQKAQEQDDRRQTVGSRRRASGVATAAAVARIGAVRARPLSRSAMASVGPASAVRTGVGGGNASLVGVTSVSVSSVGACVAGVRFHHIDLNFRSRAGSDVNERPSFVL